MQARTRPLGGSADLRVGRGALVTRLNILLLLAVVASALLMVSTAYDARRLFTDLHRADVEALALAHAQSAEAQVVTLSIGVAYWPSPQPNGLEEAQRLADEALYAAKAEGRNRVVGKLLNL